MKTPPYRPAVSPLLNRLLLVAAWTLFALSDRGRAQSRAFDATHLSTPRDLNSEWLMQVGDSPSFAEPELDDSHWTSVDLNTPLTQALHGARPQVVWYRLRIQVDPAQTGLALREISLARAFEVYVNGERIMASGEIVPFRPYTYGAPVLARIPERMVATGHLMVAARVRIGSPDWSNEFPGLSVGNLTLGAESTMADQDWLEGIGQNFANLLDKLLIVAVGLVALPLFLSQRRQREYLWIFCLGMIQVGELPVKAIGLFHNLPVAWLFFSASFTIASPILVVAMYFAFVNRRIGRKFQVFLWIAGLLNAYSALGNQGLVPVLPGGYELLTNLPFAVLLAVVVPAILAVDWRRGNGEAGILLLPALFFSLFIYADYAVALLLSVPAWNAAAQRWLDLILRYPIGPFSVSLSDVGGILSTLALAVIIVLRSGTTSRRQALLEGELEAAREVQQVILPEQIDTIAGFAIESAYEPAQQVGGDFFQIVPAGDGGLLLVLGDVAGKGLPAAMLVSVLVGATRTAAAYSHEPAEILAQLNERLMGRSRGGFSTALAAYFSRDGVVTIANAGHLSPYLDGREVDLPGALPLGILSGASYAAIRIDLQPGSRLTFYSDGVIEAQNQHGELLGFDRSRELSTQPAADIVRAAQQFGQSDDITVVAITRNSAVRAAA